MPWPSTILKNNLAVMQKLPIKYPILLIHGLFGFEKIAGYPYFYKIAEKLEQQGAIVFAPAVSAANTTEQRGRQLILQIEQILANTQANKVNLIGHSHGALTARYAAAHQPHLIASVTSVNGVNHGSEIADLLLNAMQNKLSMTITNQLIKGLLRFTSLLSTQPHLPQDFAGALGCLSTAGVSLFNQQYPQGLPHTWGGEGAELASNGVYYYSWSGILNNLPLKASNKLSILHLASRYFTRERHQNDGLVGRFSSHLGKVIRSDYPMDHAAAINQLAGHCNTSIDPVQLYSEHLQRLAVNGL